MKADNSYVYLALNHVPNTAVETSHLICLNSVLTINLLLHALFSSLFHVRNVRLTKFGNLCHIPQLESESAVGKRLDSPGRHSPAPVKLIQPVKLPHPLKVGRCSDSQPAGLSQNYTSQNPFLRGLRRLATGEFCLRFERREGSSHYPL